MPAAFTGLTARENEVLAHLVANRTNAEIAEALFISEKTVSVHVSNLLRKTDTGSRREVAALRSPDVLYVERNQVLRLLAAPNDPSFVAGNLWGLDTYPITEDADIDAPEAWNITTGSPNVVVAVIDSGIDYTHEDLAANMFRNEADCNANGVDDDGNGFVDDCYGIDTINGDSDPMDDDAHGTHVAGIDRRRRQQRRRRGRRQLARAADAVQDVRRATASAAWPPPSPASTTSR